MHDDSRDVKWHEKRKAARSAQLLNYRAEIKLVGEPLYQFRVSDVSTQGAGLLITPGSRFLQIVEVGQILEVNFLSPQGTEPSGWYQSEVKHITEMETGPYKGLKQIGVQILGKAEKA
ncbi:MAG: PilZ domain-containing protein [Desulfobacterales bacterium]|nr:PilZ domain-containing protein [Desulfobacterales bacterium]MDJ0856096.1 PilZ domain-containing protein [Desulfobacterales bacterium]MDJ0988867.1 PilZ domain-containing protein [Desulfobacterales bacterium]